ncbi:hypothetical protein J6590_055532 [Homalodisca vitripennis]|nr:hypothetical protein J6590_055532 [Homalodisca vitripennis]
MAKIMPLVEMWLFPQKRLSYSKFPAIPFTVPPKQRRRWARTNKRLFLQSKTSEKKVVAYSAHPAASSINIQGRRLDIPASIWIIEATD